jgi:hypothetical protein
MYRRSQQQKSVIRRQREVTLQISEADGACIEALIHREDDELGQPDPSELRRVERTAIALRYTSKRGREAKIAHNAQPKRVTCRSQKLTLNPSSCRAYVHAKNSWRSTCLASVTSTTSLRALGRNTGVTRMLPVKNWIGFLRSCSCTHSQE